MLVKNHRQRGRLNDLEREESVGVNSRNAVREATRERIVTVQVVRPLLLQGTRPRLEDDVLGFEADCQVSEEFLILGHPYSG